MEYDEIRITTRREISVCKGAILKLEQIISGFEKKYQFASADFLEGAGQTARVEAGDMTPWRNSCLALDRWKDRLKEHLEIMKL
jgi:hypothetical protein